MGLRQRELNAPDVSSIKGFLIIHKHKTREEAVMHHCITAAPLSVCQSGSIRTGGGVLPLLPPPPPPSL